MIKFEGFEQTIRFRKQDAVGDVPVYNGLKVQV